MPLDQILPPILTSWAPFWLSESTLRALWAQTGPGTPKTSKKHIFWAQVWTTFDTQRRLKITHVLNVFFRPSPERFLRASGLHFESFWPPVWRLFGTRGKSENCAIAWEWTLLRGFERVTFTIFLRILTRPLSRVPAEVIFKRSRAHFGMPFWPKINTFWDNIFRPFSGPPDWIANCRITTSKSPFEE